MNCARCGHTIHPQFRHCSRKNSNNGRDLCKQCYAKATRDGTLADYERRTRSRDELLDDYMLLRSEGYSWRHIAERLGMTYPAFERAMLRARADGDPRAARPGEARRWPAA